MCEDQFSGPFSNSSLENVLRRRVTGWTIYLVLTLLTANARVYALARDQPTSTRAGERKLILDTEAGVVIARARVLRVRAITVIR